MKPRRLAFFLLTFWLAACAAPPAPEAPAWLEIGRTPALRPLNPALEACAATAGVLPAILDRLPIQMQDSNIDLFVRFGLEPDWPGPAYLLGEATLVLALHPDNPLRNLTEAEIRQIFSGAVENWSALGGDPLAIQPWTLGDGGDLQGLIAAEVLAGQLPRPETRLAASVEQMIEAIGADPAATAILPAAWLPADYNSIPLTARLPLFAHSRAEPQGAAAAWLACLQSPDGQAAIETAMP